MKLIYHDIKFSNPISPFDKELVSIASGQNILLVSPYIGLSYLKRLIKISKSWRLITDFEELILSHPNDKQRLEICEFFNNHFVNVKHIQGIHAKVMVTENSAFLGSANFTEKGILTRTEMSVSFSEADKVKELKDWFNSLWKEATNFTKKQLAEFVMNNENIIIQPRITRLESSYSLSKRKSILVPLENFQNPHKDLEQELIKAIKKTNMGNKWLNKCFNLIREMLIEFGIEKNSQIISMSVSKNHQMKIIIGDRLIITHREDAVGLILPIGFRNVISDYPEAEINERYFYDKNKNQEALWVEFESNVILSHDKFLFGNWKNAVKTEIDRTMISRFRKNHNPFYYQAVMDLNYRRQILKLSNTKGTKN